MSSSYIFISHIAPYSTIIYIYTHTTLAAILLCIATCMFCLDVQLQPKLAVK